jgi:hypothetical protein
LPNIKRLCRYHYHNSTRDNTSVNNESDNSIYQSYFNKLASLYRENKQSQLHNWDKPLFGSKHTSLQKILANANKTIEKSTKFPNKIKSKQLSCSIRAKSIPENATVRKEYVKCGKQMCELKHGPYYYAYWKDPESKKLRKKYIVDHMPKDKEFDNDYGSYL